MNLKPSVLFHQSASASRAPSCLARKAPTTALPDGSTQIGNAAPGVLGRLNTARLVKRDTRHLILSALIFVLLVPFAAAPLFAQKTLGPGKAPQTVTWEFLVPKGWDPSKHFQGRERDLSTIQEGSAIEAEMMRELREIWDNAPTRTDLQGARIRLPGYVVPIEVAQGGRVSQFLLVPYFGACIHSPPPPANQIVHVTLKAPGPWRTMDAVWVSGTLATQRQNSSMGVSGYAMVADSVQAYHGPSP